MPTLKKIYGSNLFLIGGLIVLAVGGAQFFNTAVRPRLGGGY